MSWDRINKPSGSYNEHATDALRFGMEGFMQEEFARRMHERLRGETQPARAAQYPEHITRMDPGPAGVGAITLSRKSDGTYGL